MTITPATQSLLPVTVELLPCPFCGGAAKVDDEESEDVGGYFASCTKCPVSAWGDARSEAIAAWNTRQAHSLPGDVGASPLLALVAGYADYKAISDDRWEQGKAAGYRELGEMVAAALTPSALSGDAGATGPWLKVGTFEPEPDALYLVRGTLRISVKRGVDIDADNSAAALIAALPSHKGTGE